MAKGRADEGNSLNRDPKDELATTDYMDHEEDAGS
jgi:hypothetical protein